MNDIKTQKVVLVSHRKTRGKVEIELSWHVGSHSFNYNIRKKLEN